MTPPKGIRNLLIDLGGVLYEIDIEGTLQKYNRLRPPHKGAIDYGKQSQHEWFSLLDTGRITMEQFEEGLRQDFELDATGEEIRQIWRELLIGVYPGRAESLRQLGARYRMALLSNTSRFHFEHYREECRPLFEQMSHLFLSFEMGLRKPDPAIYRLALDTAGWLAEETLFIDDSHANIRAAEQLGLRTWWVEEPDDFEQMVLAYA